MKVAVIDVSKGVVLYHGETDAKPVDGIYYLVTKPDGTRDYTPIVYVFKLEHATTVCNILLEQIAEIKEREQWLYKAQLAMRERYGPFGTAKAEVSDNAEDFNWRNDQ